MREEQLGHARLEGARVALVSLACPGTQLAPVLQRHGDDLLYAARERLRREKRIDISALTKRLPRVPLSAVGAEHEAR